MKPRSILLYACGGALLALSACNVNVQEGNGTPANGMPLDSGTTITTHTEEHTTSHTGFEVKGEVNSESHTTIHSTTTASNALNLNQQVDQWHQQLFPDYKTVEMDPMEAYPKYKSATETVFRRIRMKNPISNNYGKAVYPRLLMKAYRFANTTSLTTEVEGWLNTLGSATPNIQLGQDVKAMKSPPLLCVIVGTDFLVVQTGCVYEGKEWTATKELFFTTFQNQGATYAWEIQCDGGALKYRMGGES